MKKAFRYKFLLLLVSLLLITFRAPLLTRATSTNKDDKLEERFRYLYDNDPEFKGAVNKIRETLSKAGQLSEEEWGNIRLLFNIVAMKLVGKVPNDAEFAELRRLAKEERVSEAVREKLEQLPTPTTATVDSNAWLPALYQPTMDINNGNGLICTYSRLFDETVYDYVLPGYYIIEVTYIFADEDHPNPIIDWWWDAFRMTFYGRIKDIETFFIVVNKATSSIVRLSFIYVYLWWGTVPPEVREWAPIYSGSNTWSQEAHFWAKVSTGITYYIGNHPKIYVNTWNHAMAECDNNPSLTKTVFATFTSTEGNREVAENMHSSIVYWDEWLEESP